MKNINYRKDQVPIINYDKGTMAVPAVPGAGKTFIVTNLVAKLLLEGKHEKSKILILTYMNSAVNNFKGRIKSILQDNEINEINSYEVMTIHSLATKIIKEKPESIMLNDEFNVADELQKTMILNECINNFRLNGGERAYNFFLKEQKDDSWLDIMHENWQRGFFELVSTTISKLKYKEISPTQLQEIIPNGYKGMLKIMVPMYKEYDAKLKQNGLLDYDDLLILAYKALKNDEELRMKFQNKYKYIFEDECQDSNEIQGKIIKLICKDNNNLVRVGDINQSITGTFSSSDPKFFKQFIEEADCCYRMDMSNRSSKDILDLANRLVEYVTKEFKQIECRNALEDMQIKTVESNMGYKENPKPEIYSINTKRYETWEDEILQTVKYAKSINKKYKDKSIGILVPFNDHISQISNILINEDIEFEELGPNATNKRKILINLSYIIDFIINCDDIEKLINVLDKVFIKTENKIGKKDLIERLRLYDTEDIIYKENLIDELIYDEHNDIYISTLKGINQLKDILNLSSIDVESFIMDIGNILDLEKEEQAIIDYLVFYIKFIQTDNKSITLQNIYDLISDNKNKVFNYIVEVVYEMNGYEPRPGVITICNYHKSKGLEWDCVFLLGMSEFNFPDNINQKFQSDKWYLKDKYKNPIAIIESEIDALTHGTEIINYAYKTKVDLINEKIRLLYVGITRAKEMLILSSSAYKDKNDIGKIKKLQKQCLYINELEKHINSKKGSKNNA